MATCLYYAIGNAAGERTRTSAPSHAAVDVPVFAYDVPVRTHFKLPTDLLVELGRDGVIAGVKDSSGDDVSFRQLLLAAKDIPNFDIFTGHEVVVDGALLGGAQGVVPGLGNVDPAGYRRLYDAAVAGDWAGAAAEQDRLADVFEIVYTPKAGRVSGNAAGLGAFKTALQLMGVIKTNVMSAPMLSLDEDETEAVKVILERNGLDLVSRGWAVALGMLLLPVAALVPRALTQPTQKNHVQRCQLRHLGARPGSCVGAHRRPESSAGRPATGRRRREVSKRRQGRGRHRPGHKETDRTKMQYAIGVDLGGTKTAAGVVSADGRCCFRRPFRR